MKRSGKPLFTREAYVTEVLPPYRILDDQLALKGDCSEVSCNDKATCYQLIRIAGLQFVVLFCDEHVKPLEDWFKE